MCLVNYSEVIKSYLRKLCSWVLRSRMFSSSYVEILILFWMCRVVCDHVSVVKCSVY